MIFIILTIIALGRLIEAVCNDSTSIALKANHSLFEFTRSSSCWDNRKLLISTSTDLGNPDFITVSNKVVYVTTTQDRKGKPFSTTELSITEKFNEDHCYNIEWNRKHVKDSNKSSIPLVLEDCIHLGNQTWFSGQEIFTQHFASKASLGNFIPMQPFISSDIISETTKLGGVLEAFWLSSDGWSIRVTDYSFPLWYSFNDNNNTEKSRHNALCLKSDNQNYNLYKPISTSTNTILRYSICSARNIREAWQEQVLSVTDLNEQAPAMSMIEKPIWSTWAQFKKDINQDQVLKYARDIVDSGIPYSVMEIDDMWSSTYGDFTFNATRFPDPEAMVNELHRLGFDVMVWIVPFCDENALVYREGEVNQYWVRQLNKKGDLETARVRWWDNNQEGSAVLDVTNPQAREWFLNRIRSALSQYGIDGVKLDAGETVYIPTSNTAVYHNLLALHSGTGVLEYTALYSSLAQEISSISEVRAAWKLQRVATFVRVMDLNSVWGYENGLSAAVSRLLTFSLLGYRFVLPDMIGGNGYGPDGELFVRNQPPEELYIRWAQMNVILPMQMSIPPWRYNSTLVTTAFQKMLKIRNELFPLYQEAIQDSKLTGMPLVRPMWWKAPHDLYVLSCEDQFMVGDEIVMAPILESNATQRKIFIPMGLWAPCDVDSSSRAVDGPTTIILENITIFSIPCYRRLHY